MLTALDLKYEYPHTKKWVIFSCVLIALSIGFVFIALNDMFSIVLYFIITFIFAVVFYFIKINLYSKKSSWRTTELEDEKPISGKFILFIFLILILAVSLPFLLLLFVAPAIWFLVITAFIAGINIPEVVLYTRYVRAKSNS